MGLQDKAETVGELAVDTAEGVDVMGEDVLTGATEDETVGELAEDNAEGAAIVGADVLVGTSCIEHPRRLDGPWPGVAAGQGSHFVECFSCEHLGHIIGLELLMNFLLQW